MQVVSVMVSLRNTLCCQTLLWKYSKWLGHVKYASRLNLFFKICISSKNEVLLLKQKLLDSINEWITEWNSKAYGSQELSFRDSYQSPSALHLLFMHELYEYGIFQFLLTDAVIYLIEDSIHSVSATKIRVLTGGG